MIMAVACLVGCDRPRSTPTNGEDSALQGVAEKTSLDGAVNDESRHHSVHLADARESGTLNKIPRKHVTTRGDPAYGGERRFEAWPLAKLLEETLDFPVEAEGIVIQFIAQDGYRATVPLKDLPLEDGYVAFRRSDTPEDERWPAFEKGDSNVTPAPFYLIWSSSSHSDNRPWAYKLVRIKWEHDSSLWGDAVPPRHHAGDTGTSQTMRAGFEVFRKHCIKCHSVNLSGGAVGPELNVPMNVTEYWQIDHLRSYIRNPSSYRADAEMPSMATQLSGAAMSNLLTYLRGMAQHKICKTASECSKL
jgi:mono/diheme cytochrome c family protein